MHLLLVLVTLTFCSCQASFYTECQRQSGMIRPQVHPAQICDLARRKQPSPYVGKACMHAAHHAYKDATDHICNAHDWMEGVLTPGRGGGSHPYIIHFDSADACDNITTPPPPLTDHARAAILLGCQEGYRVTYILTFQILTDEMAKSFPPLAKLNLKNEEVFVDRSAPVRKPPPVPSPPRPSNETMVAQEMNMEGGMVSSSGRRLINQNEKEQDTKDSKEMKRYLPAELPGGNQVFVPLLADTVEDSLGAIGSIEHSVTTYCRASLPHIGSVCSRHLLKFIRDHQVQPKTYGELMYRRQ